MPARASASTRPGSSEPGIATVFDGRSASALSATIRPSRRAGSIAIAQGVSSRLVSGHQVPVRSRSRGRSDRCCNPDRLQRAAVVDAEDVGAGAHREGDRGDRPPLALGRRQPLLPGAGEDGADEVLARERDVERQPELAELAEPPQDLEVLLGAEVEVEPGVDRDLLLADAKLAAARSTRPPNQDRRCSTTSS